MISSIAEMLIRDEQERMHIYDDKTGGLAILASGGNITGGVGRNLSAVDFSHAEVDLMLKDDIDKVVTALSHYSWFTALDPVRSAGIVNMAFNMGVPGLLTGWPNLIAAAARQDYVAMHAEALSPLWISQVGARARRVALMFLTGEWQ